MRIPPTFPAVLLLVGAWGLLHRRVASSADAPDSSDASTARPTPNAGSGSSSGANTGANTSTGGTPVQLDHLPHDHPARGATNHPRSLTIVLDDVPDEFQGKETVQIHGRSVTYHWDQTWHYRKRDGELHIGIRPNNYNPGRGRLGRIGGNKVAGQVGGVLKKRGGWRKGRLTPVTIDGQEWLAHQVIHGDLGATKEVENGHFLAVQLYPRK